MEGALFEEFKQLVSKIEEKRIALETALSAFIKDPTNNRAFLDAAVAAVGELGKEVVAFVVPHADEIDTLEGTEVAAKYREETNKTRNLIGSALLILDIVEPI